MTILLDDLACRVRARFDDTLAIERQRRLRAICGEIRDATFRDEVATEIVADDAA